MDRNPTSPQRIWIVTPCYADVASFLQLREQIRTELTALPATATTALRFAVIDDTAGQDAEIALLTALDDVDVIEPPFNLGHQRGLVFGLRSLAGCIEADDLVITLDADGEDRPQDIPALIEPLLDSPSTPGSVVLAARTSRQESVTFKAFYVLFKLLFRALTGTTIRSGNFAAYRGSVVHGLLRHPHFDLCYSSSFISLDAPVLFVPCPRGHRYAGRSRMNRERLILHGLRMLMPFMDRIALRALGGLAALVVVATGFLVSLAIMWAFTDARIGTWSIGLGLALVVAALIGIACCVILFALFAQSRGISLSGLEVADDRRTRIASSQSD